MYYYLVSFYAKEITFVVREEDLASIVSDITSKRCSVVITGYISKDELPDCYILLSHSSLI